MNEIEKYFDEFAKILKPLKVKLKQSLILRVTTLGYYVRNGKSPSFDDTKEFLNNWRNDKV